MIKITRLSTNVLQSTFKKIRLATSLGNMDLRLVVAFPKDSEYYRRRDIAIMVKINLKRSATVLN